MLPDLFVHRMQTLLGSEAQDLIQALGEANQAGLRVNTNKLSPQAFLASTDLSLEPIDWLESGFLLNKSGAGKHPFHAAGLYYLQEPSAMSVAEVVAPQEGDWVLDLAAAPGGKSTHLSSLMKDTGLLVSNDVNRQRCRALLENLERWGAKNSLIMNAEVSRLAEQWGAIFDRVLLDAPCSGEGMFRKSEDARSMWNLKTIQDCALRQTGLINDAAKLVKEGGFLVYSTCTFAPEENEHVIAKFLEDTPNFTLESIELTGADKARADWSEPKNLDLAKAIRLWPHKLKGEGHFVALLKNNSSKAKKIKNHRFQKLTKKETLFCLDFLHDCGIASLVKEKSLVLYGKKVFAVPKLVPDFSSLHTLRCGLHLGNLEKNRFEPSHSLALALMPGQVKNLNHIDFNEKDPALISYLKGYGLECEGPKGWTIISANGFALGWGKRSGISVNNAYPKGLRWQA